MPSYLSLPSLLASPWYACESINRTVVLLVSAHMTVVHGPLAIVYIVTCIGRYIFTWISPLLLRPLPSSKGYYLKWFPNTDPYQNFDFLEGWTAFMQKLSNVFGSYSLKDDDKDTIVVITFPNNEKVVNYFIKFVKYQNYIYWDDHSLRKVVKNTIPNWI